jgi:hypothetical protein
VTGTIESTTGFTGIQESDVPTLSAYAALAGSTTQNFSAGSVGMGVTASASYKLYVKHTDTTATGSSTAAYIDANYEGSDTFTGDMTNRGLYIDVDSSATGGGTSHEHRLYGVYADVRHTGDSDICYAGYFYARSDHSAGTCSALRGIYASAQDSANGTNSGVYAGEFKALKDSGSTNTTGTMMGIRAEVEIDAGTITNAYGVHSHIDRDGGTITNGYLFHGSYAGSDTGVKWGIHLSGAEKNYLTGTLQVGGNVGIGTDSPQGQLHISSGTSGDCVLILQADTDNNNESDNPRIEFRQDGALIESAIAQGNNDLQIKNGLTGITFWTGGTASGDDYITNTVERMRIKEDGNVGIGTASPALGLHVNVQYSIMGKTDTQSGIIYNDIGTAKWRVKTGSYNLNFDRHSSSSSSNYTSFTSRGYLASNGSNVRLNFTGQHRTFITDVPFTEAKSKEGLIVSANRDTYIKMSDGVAYGAKAITINECLPIVTLSQKTRDKTCFGVISLSEDPETREEAFGVFVSVFDKEKGDTRIFVNSVGEGGIWVVNMNDVLESGDYITTSNIPGYGMKQNDDLLHNYTVAKITMNCDFNPTLQKVKRIKKKMSEVKYWVNISNLTVTKEEYDELQPEFRRIIQDENENDVYQTDDKTEWTRDPVEEGVETFTEIRNELQNDLDEHDQIQWEDTDETEKAYKIRFLLPDGTQISEEEYTTRALANEEVYLAAFVGCTYHCG